MSLAFEETARSLLSSAGAATLSQIWRIGVTLATHIALRRMIPPEELGPWFWIEPFFLILALVRDLGVPAHVVRDPRRPYGDFLRLQLTWGLAFAALIFVAAPWLARAYHDPEAPMVEMIRVLSAFLAVQGLGAVPLIYFEAELQVVKAIPAELARNAVFAVVSLSLAWTGFGVWSAVLAHLVAGIVFNAMLWWAVRPALANGRLRLEMGTIELRRLGWIGVPLMVMAVLEQLVLKLDAFVLGLRFPNEVVGTAGLAAFAVFFFSRLLADPIGRALYPAFVRYTHRPKRAFEAYETATLILASFSTPCCFFLFVNAEALVWILGGEEWTGAAGYLRILSLVPLLRPLTMFGLEYLLTHHRDRLLIVYTATNFVTLSGAGLLLTRTQLGPEGMAVAGYFPLGVLVLAWAIRRLDPRGLARLCLRLSGLYATTAALFLPTHLWVDGTWWRFGISSVAGLVTLAYAWSRFGDATLRFFRDQEE
ncbi:MAG: oligosaccharide flippase family protein [Holophagales bacterium]|nr:oligosaccharide flippase family protein [Holophagales bacterium]